MEYKSKGLAPCPESGEGGGAGEKDIQLTQQTDPIYCNGDLGKNALFHYQLYSCSCF